MAVAILGKTLLFVYRVGTILLILGVVSFLVVARIALVAVLVVSLAVLLIHKSCLLFVAVSYTHLFCSRQRPVFHVPAGTIRPV